MLEYSMLYPETTETRTAMKLDGMWKFAIDWNSEGDENGWKDGIPGHDMIPVPASFNDFYTEKAIREFTGDVWYEKDIVVPSSMKGSRVFLRFGAATHRAEVYVNGAKAGEHEGGFLPFLVDITELAALGRMNRIVVKVNNELTETNIPCGRTITLSSGRKMTKPYFDFYNYSGLQRSVYLVSTPKNSIFDIDLNYKVGSSSATIEYLVKVKGKGDVFLSLMDDEGMVVSSSAGQSGKMEVSSPHLWQVRNAYLYNLKVDLKDGDVLLDTYELPIGIRDVRIEGTSILINGSPVYLKGFGKHEDSDIVGRGFNIGVMKRDFELMKWIGANSFRTSHYPYDEEIYRMAELMKWIGANSFRTSHYPYDEEIYRMADREGFLIIDEVPAVGLFESLVNFLDAGTGKGAKSFFSKPTTPILLKSHLRAVEEMIVRDKNHPSVIAWSLLNEPESTDENSVPYFTEVFNLAHDLDPQKRPRTFAMEVNSSTTRCKCYHLSDFICHTGIKRKMK